MIAVSPKGFLTNPPLQWIDPINEVQRLLGPLVYVSGAGETITVPAGFQTDYASIPEIFWNLPGFSPTGPSKIPAILHDWLYEQRGHAPANKTRRQSDDLFLEAMQLVGVSWIHRQVIYRAVRIFGGIHSAGPNIIGNTWKKS